VCGLLLKSGRQLPAIWVRPYGGLPFDDLRFVCHLPQRVRLLPAPLRCLLGRLGIESELARADLLVDPRGLLADLSEGLLRTLEAAAFGHADPLLRFRGDRL